MAVKPLDLQVNMQASLAVSDRESARNNEAIERQKRQDLKNIEDAKKSKESVTAADESEEGKRISDEEQQRQPEGRQSKPKKQPESEKKKDAEKNHLHKNQAEDGHIDLLA